jgi:Secreted repeat of unknown function
MPAALTAVRSAWPLASLVFLDRRHQPRDREVVIDHVDVDVEGPATAGSGVTGTLSTITRPDGSTQATYDRHPLYTYAGDTAPGQAKGNGLNLSGGVWHEVTVSGSGAPAASTSPSAAGGYGY